MWTQLLFQGLYLELNIDEGKFYHLRLHPGGYDLAYQRNTSPEISRALEVTYIHGPREDIYFSRTKVVYLPVTS